METGPLIWGKGSDFWPADIPEALGRLGMDYDATIADIEANPGKYDAVWKANQKMGEDSGHAGVPNMIFRGEPFFGQDRVADLFMRLVQNGLTRRDKPIEPIIDMPPRFPDYDRERELVFGK